MKLELKLKIMMKGTMYDDDIYYDEVSVSVSRKMITFASRAERQRRKARRQLSLVGGWPAFA